MPAADGDINASVPATIKQNPKDVPVKVEVREGLGDLLHAVAVAAAELTRPMRDVDPPFLRDYQSARKVSQRSHFLTHPGLCHKAWSDVTPSQFE